MATNCQTNSSRKRRDILAVNAMSEDTARWLAGFFEGEGCVAFYNKPERKMSGVLRVSVTQKHAHSMATLMKCVGAGNINASHRPRDVFSLIVHGEVGVALLGKLLPFMRMKHKIDQAITALESYAMHLLRTRRPRCLTADGHWRLSSQCKRPGQHPHTSEPYNWSLT